MRDYAIIGITSGVFNKYGAVKFPGKEDSWTHLFAFYISGIFILFIKGVGNGPVHIKFIKFNHLN